jgi:predicted component of type VI protein secretion system
MLARLHALGDGPSITIDKPVILVGRQAECDIQINSRKVSRRHCCLALVDGYLLVRDLGSTNGVWINGVRVVEGKLRSGDELTIGDYCCRVSITEPMREKSNRNNGPRQEAPAPDEGREPPSPSSASLAPLNGLLESCELPIPLEPHRPPAAGVSLSSLAPFPDQINLRSDSKLS